jgi:uncharacterized protein (DUF302 family)
MNELSYTVKTGKGVDEAVAAVEKAAQDKKFRVLFVHNVDRTLKEKGFEREPYRIVEICNAVFASKVLEEDISIGLFLPCKINVYAVEGQTYISGMNPGLMSRFVDNPQINSIAADVEKIIHAIVDGAK